MTTDHTNPPTESELRLMAYLDGELPLEERAAFELELEQNRELQADLHTHRALADFVKRNADCLYPKSLDSLADDVMQSLPIGRPSRVVGKPKRATAVVIPVAFALAIAAGLAIFYGTRAPVHAVQPSVSSPATTVVVIEPSSSLVTASSQSDNSLIPMTIEPSEVEDLEVSDSASILIYTVEGRRTPVIWIHDQNETKGL